MREQHTSCVTISMGDRTFVGRYYTERHSDIRETPWGKVDFGHVVLGPTTYWEQLPDGSEREVGAVEAILAA